jgi:hypothetical protein
MFVSICRLRLSRMVSRMVSCIGGIFVAYVSIASLVKLEKSFASENFEDVEMSSQLPRHVLKVR